MPTCSVDRASWWRAVTGLSLAAVLASPAAAGPMLLADAASGEVIFQREAGRPWYPASVTKLMTAYVACQRCARARFALKR
ncbi:MAG: hypothetical protein HC900_09250 [Methylacidiphilales bacterium]|nr:hypothetical protein [Candidatus Methylacidiphilales bacterium]